LVELAKDFLTEIVEERTRQNHGFSRLLAEAELRRLRQLTSEERGDRLGEMSAAAMKRLVAKAKRELSTKERAALASELLESLDYPGEPVSAEEAGDASRAEALRRAERVVRGAVTGVPAEKVHAAIRRKLRTRR
jgi:putative addiction module component (TIGR02574 family)